MPAKNDDHVDEDDYSVRREKPAAQLFAVVTALLSVQVCPDSFFSVSLDLLWFPV